MFKNGNLFQQLLQEIEQLLQQLFHQNGAPSGIPSGSPASPSGPVPSQPCNPPVSQLPVTPVPVTAAISSTTPVISIATTAMISPVPCSASSTYQALSNRGRNNPMGGGGNFLQVILQFIEQLLNEILGAGSQNTSY
jgi:hypothetical protein